MPSRESRGAWVDRALALLAAERAAEPGTPLRQFPLPEAWGIELFLKDESLRPTGSLKHTTARILIGAALADGRVHEGTPLVVATSGHLAVAVAHFARLLGLPCTAVLPRRTTAAKRGRIERQGGRCLLVDPPLAVYERAADLATSVGGHYVDHLDRPASAAGKALGTEILGDLARVGRPAPAWIVAGVGSGATSAGIGRCLRQRGLPTRLAVVDPENSAYFAGWVMDCPGYSTGMPSHIEGIGRPRVEAAFDASAVDLVIPVPDAASVAAMRWLRARAAVQAGPSTGAALWGALRMVDRMRRDGVTGSVAAVMADGGAPYADTYYADDWVAAKGWELGGPTAELERFLATGAWPR